MKNFVKFLIPALLIFAIAMSNDSYAQMKTKRELRKERKEMRKRVNEKAIRKARKEAKRLEKEEGWSVFPGALPMEKMLEDSWMKQYEMRTNDDFSETNAYIWASGNSVARTKNAAQIEAQEVAKLNLAGQLETHVRGLTDISIANAQLTTVDAETKQEIVTSAMNFTTSTLTNIKPVVILKRTNIPKKTLRKTNTKQLASGTVEVQVMLFYDLYQAEMQVRQAIVKSLEEKLKDNKEELKKVMNIKNSLEN